MKSNHCSKRLGSLAMSLTMALSLLPTSAFAVTDPGLTSPFTSETVLHGSDVKSKKYRIPVLLESEAKDDTTLYASADVRWTGRGDSPANLDTAFSVSKDNGKTWETKLVNHFQDHKDGLNEGKNSNDWEEDYLSKGRGSGTSASFIDPALIEKDGVLYLLVDALPAYTGLASWWNNGAIKSANETIGYDENGNLLLQKGTAGKAASESVSDYTYYVDARVSVEADGKVLHPIKDRASGDEQGFYVDAEFYLYDSEKNPILCRQYDTDSNLTNVMIHCNVFFHQSQWKVYPTWHIWLRTSTDGGETWSAPDMLNPEVKLPGEGFLGVAPGRGFVTDSGRIIFPMYDNSQNEEYASVIYSDDDGNTWHRGSRADQVGAGQKSSESQIVRLDENTIRMFSRGKQNNTPIRYTDSTDGGKTWGPYRSSGLAYEGGCMTSFINIDYTYGGAPVVVGALPEQSRRNYGAIRMGYIEGGDIHWLDDKIQITEGNATSETDRSHQSFAYSCLADLGDGRVGLLYESDEPGGVLDFQIFDLKPFLQRNPIRINGTALADNKSATCDMTQDYVLSVYGTSDGATVVWGSDKESVAVVENGKLVMKTDGKVTLTVTVTEPGQPSYEAKVELTIIDSSKVNVAGGAKSALDLTIEVPADARVEWSVKDADIAGVYPDSSDPTGRTGQAVGRTAGKTTLTASVKRADGKILGTQSWDVTVSSTWQSERPNDPNLSYTVGSADHCKVYYSINGGALKEVKAGETLDDCLFTRGSAVTFFAAPDHGYKLTSMNGNFFEITNGKADGTLSSFWPLNDPTGDKFVYPHKPSNGSGNWWDPGDCNSVGSKWMLVEGNMTVPAFKATMAEALRLGCTGAICFTKNGGQTDAQTLTFETEKLPSAQVSFQWKDTKNIPAGVRLPSPAEVVIGDRFVPTPLKDVVVSNGTWHFDGWDPAVIESVSKDTMVTGSWTFRADSSSSGSAAFFDISVGSTKNGTVTADRSKAPAGSSVTLTVQPDRGFVLSSLKAVAQNGREVTLSKHSDHTYTFWMPSSPVKIQAVFSTLDNRFTDVSKEDYFYDAVQWACVNGVAAGTPNGTFLPDTACTRAQIVTFLWNAAGAPVSGNRKPVFSDVPSDAYYANAVTWAVESGITSGTGADTFSPDLVCTRAQAVTFLHNFAKNPVHAHSSFTDVAADAYYAPAVDWAAAAGITSGTGTDTFGPHVVCTRAQIVTFLYRMLGR